MATINSVGTGLLGESGSGSFVGSNGATLVAPALGTPASGNLINCTGNLRSVNKQTFTNSGTYTPTAGMQYCIIECWGSGGGGAGIASIGAAGYSSNAAGGGAGGYSRTIATASTIGASKTVTVNNAGTGGAAGNNNGTNGGSVSVGSICIANGGSGSNTYNGGAGGTAGTGDVAGTGESGGPASGYQQGSVSVSVNQGSGGSTSIGGGARPRTLQDGSGPGFNGTGYGAGGGGAFTQNTDAAQAGGNGSKGFVLITEFL